MRQYQRQRCIDYNRATIGQEDPEYGGVVTDISELPVGTTFFVCNGAWNGKIVEEAGQLRVEYTIGMSQALKKGDINNLLAIAHIKPPGETLLAWDVRVEFADGSTAQLSLSRRIVDTMSYAQKKTFIHTQTERFIQDSIKGHVRWTVLRDGH